VAHQCIRLAAPPRPPRLRCLPSAPDCVIRQFRITWVMTIPAAIASAAVIIV
jgi:hypothetical protein